jgi:holin-like protein
MKYVRQFLIILVISFIGELLRYYIPLKIPASIYGLVLLFAALELRIIKLVSIRETSRFLIEIMPLMFVPAGVGLLSSWGVLKPVCVPIMVIVLISTIIVMAVSGKVTQGVIHMEKKHPKKKNGADHIYVKDSEGERQYISENSI